MDLIFEILRKLVQKYRFFRITQKRINQFVIPETLNLHDSPDYLRPELASRFSPSYESFKILLVDLNERKKPSTFYKFGDGDFYFLRGEPYGSAKPGSRALSKNYEEIDLERFKRNSLMSDYYMCEIPDGDRERFQVTFPNKKIDFPAEYVYGAVASRWIFRQFDGNLGLIGASQKIDLIEKLLQFEEYRNYLGVTQNVDLIRIPQKFACDDLDSTLRMLSGQLLNSTANVFLFGVGHVKSGIISELNSIRKAMYIDVGSGIDALAGIIDIRRPYFGDWKNFRVDELEYYQNLDFLQLSNPGKIRYLK
jgi:hypothetical protein